MVTVTKEKNYTDGGKARQLAGLHKPWQSGESGNPKGRPPIGNLCRPIVTQELRKLLRSVQEGKLIGAEVLARAWYEEAKKSPYYFALLLDRVEGKAPTPPGDQPVSYQDNSRHVAITILGDGRLREMAIALQRALEAQGGVSMAVSALAPVTSQVTTEGLSGEAQIEEVAEVIEAEVVGDQGLVLERVLEKPSI